MSDPFSIAAVVILYNPPEIVIENIESYYEFVERVYVFDNSENSSKQIFTSLSKIEYYHDSENAGIAKRLNNAVSLAMKAGYSWLLTMDQDTSFSTDQISGYIACIKQFNQLHTVALFGTEYSSTPVAGIMECRYVEADNLITSGMVINMHAANIIGEFDENLFIDSIDHDYVIRAKIAGYKVIRFSNIVLLHSLGEEVHRASIKTLYLLKKKKIIHSPLRSYYMYRNMLYLENKFRGESLYLAKNLRKIVTGNLLANVFYGRNVLNTLKYLSKAKKDYKHNRMGKLASD